MINYIDEIERLLELPQWEHWHFKALKRVTIDGVRYWAVYIAYEDAGDPSGLSITTRDESLYQALRDMVTVLTGDESNEPWY